MTKETVEPPRFWDVVIVLQAGGSLTGLLYGIALKRQGRSVCILEQASSTRTNTAAGIGIGYHGQIFLKLYDLVETPFWYPVDGTNTLDSQGNFRFKLRKLFSLTSWDALFYRLRANFDGFDSGYCAIPSEPSSAGPVQYMPNKCVIGFEVAGDIVRVKYRDVQDSTEATIETSLLIGADGINSTIRRILVPKVELKFSGVVAWRGTVPELNVSAKAREAFTGLCNCPLPDYGGYTVAYAIPGKKGALEVGSRELNLVWYTEASKDILVDSDGHKHRTTLPKGKMPAHVWSEQLKKASKMFHSYREVCEKIEQPFISTVNDYMAPQVSWHGGKVVLAGEACLLVRPYFGSSFETTAFALLEFINADKHWESSVRHNNYKAQALAKMYGAYCMYGLWRISAWWNLAKFIGLLALSPLKRFIF